MLEVGASESDTPNCPNTMRHSEVDTFGKRVALN